MLLYIFKLNFQFSGWRDSLTALIAISEDPGLILSTHMEAGSHL